MHITLTINAVDQDDLEQIATMFAALKCPAHVAVVETTPKERVVAEPMPRVESVPAPPLSPATKARLAKLTADQASGGTGKTRGRPTKAAVAAREAAARGEAPPEPAPAPPKEPTKTPCPEGMTQEQFDEECRTLKQQLQAVLALRGEPFVVYLLKKYAGTHKFSCLPYEAHGPILAEAMSEMPSEKHPEAITEEELMAALPVAKQ